MLPNFRNALAWSRARLAFLINGRAAPPAVSKAAAELVIQNAGADVARLSEALQNGELTLAEWERGMREAVKRMHGANAALARGGWGQMRPADWERVGEKVKFHLEYLRGMAVRVQKGVYGPAAQSPAFNAHAQQYVNAARATYENERLAVHREGGFTEARRVLAASHHCRTCEEAAAEGWVPIGEVLPIGDAECRANCQCVIIYR